MRVAVNGVVGVVLRVAVGVVLRVAVRVAVGVAAGVAVRSRLTFPHPFSHPAHITHSPSFLSLLR